MDKGDPRFPYPRFLGVEFVFVPDGNPPPLEWMRDHPNYVTISAVFIPHPSPEPNMGLEPQPGAEGQLELLRDVGGLDALVYKSRVSLESQFGGIDFEVDGHTGEAIAVEGTEVSITPDAYVAESVRFGNAAQIGYLSREVAEVLGSFDTFIERRVLYSGSHSGDVIEVDKLAELMDEVNKLRRCGGAGVKRFAESLSVLAIAAQRERNPIVFV